MDIDVILDNVEYYNAKLFDEAIGIVEDNLDFMDEFVAIEPDRNYILLLDFLNVTIKYFSNMDHEFYETTLRKLHRDVNNLHKEYMQQLKNRENIKEIFEKKFLKRVKIFSQIKEKIEELEESNSRDIDDKARLKTMKSHYVELKNIYFESFQEEFLEQSRYVVHNLKKILNTKLYYLDQLLWIESNKSDTIWRTLKAQKVGEIFNTKEYLEYQLNIALPYSDHYFYLKKCLEVYT